MPPTTLNSEEPVCRGGADDYDHGNHHLARATTRPADPGLVICAALSALGLSDTDAPIIDELAQASATNPLMRVLADAALLDRDRRAHSTKSGASKARVPTPTSTLSPGVWPPLSRSTGAAGAHPATCPTPPCPTGTRSSCPNASACSTPPGSNRPSASRTRPPKSGPAWRWTSWNSSAHSWSTRPSWCSCARANSGPNTPSQRPGPGAGSRPGECGWAAMARESSSTRTRPPASDPSPAPCPDTRGRGAGTSPNPHRCWRAPSPNPTTSGRESPGDDLHHRLRHRR